MSLRVGTAHRHFRPDLGQTFRSSWEANVARILTSLETTWEYEPKRFSLPSGKSYAPDFLLENGIWLEVKGYLRLEAAARMAEFRENYPREILHLIDQGLYETLSRKWSHLQGWES